ncbi:hypothetical protein DMA12_24315 [Amycolatopsis balhimycina DSM 5908]|uniref:Uncharacterized protein n=1 Tax=Amycolatopsis balhimycina DSM 5908 TaxID=1081091 RepID=A0A428WEE7_AMYBA|nr:hypothetical protein [Amycolatopsis balhimycina]RSM41449.1 hypothetical protein DMA12_24315 [Amycolatopsis balhimycina DSM 5908]
MTRGAAIGGSITFISVIGLPLLLADHTWRWNEIAALCVAAFIGAGLVVFFWLAAIADSGPPRPARPVETRTPIVFMLAAAGGIWLALFIVISVFTALLDGLASFAEASYWEAWAFVLAMFLVVFTVAGYLEVTQAAVRHRAQKKRARRRSRPRDIAVLGDAGRAARQLWHKALTKLARRRIALRLPLILVAATVAAMSAGKGLGGVARLVVVALAAFLLLWTMVSAIRADWGNPLLLVVRVTGGVDGIAITGGQVPGIGSVATSVVQNGTARTLDVDVRAASFLRPDGTLVSCPHWRGKQKVGVRRAVLRQVIEGERCVLLCSGNGVALDMLGHFTSKLEARKRPAGGGEK